MHSYWLPLIVVSCAGVASAFATQPPPRPSLPVLAPGSEDPAEDDVRVKGLALSRGRVFMELKSFDLAAEQFALSLATDPEDLDVRTLYALALYADGRPEEALPELTAVARARPDNALCAEFLGRSLFQLGMFPEAASALQKSVELNPTDARLRNQLGVVRLRLDRGDEALDDFVAATKLDPFHETAHYNAGLLSAATGDLVAAKEHLEAAATLAPEDPDPAESLGDLYREEGDYTNAARWYQVAAEREPERSDLWLVFGLASREAGDLLRALTALEVACARVDAHAVAFLVLARVQEALGRSEDGLLTLEEGLGRTPQAMDLHREYANFAEDLGDPRAAAEHLEWVFAAEGAGPRDLRRLAELYESVGDLDAARRWYRVLVTTNEGRNQDLAAIAERMVSSKIEGIRNLETGLALASTLVERTRGRSLPALMVLATAELETGRSVDAVETLQRAAELFEPDHVLFAMLNERARALQR